MREEYQFLANCALGLEELIAEEIASFSGSEIVSDTGIIQWKGSIETAYRACLWSRYSSRILLKLKTYTIANEDDLYSGVLDFAWHEHMDLSTTFAIDCSLGKDAVVNHSQFAALRVKDAVVDFFKAATGDRPSVKTTQPMVRFHIHIGGSEATLFVDLSGESLHKRGYRVSGGMAPLKETLAAGIVGLSSWSKGDNPFSTLIDPMCGTGTLLIEAAMLYGDVAPGLGRNYYGFLDWKQHEPTLWKSLVDEAVSREDAGFEKSWPIITGYDADPVVVSAARKNIQRAGFDEHVQVKCSELTNLGSPSKDGTIICNLPYGERLSETEKVRQLYSAFGRIGSNLFAGWNFSAFISNPDLAESFGVSWQDKTRLYNGSIGCRILSGTFEAKENKPFVWEIKQGDMPEECVQFGNRFKKNLKKYLKAAKKAEITCFRVYDRDLPDYNLSVDIYEKWVYVQEYMPPKTIDTEVARTRFNQALRAIKETLGLRSDRVFVKRRMRQKGKGQYQKQNNRKKMYQVQEGNCRFLVNFHDYIDSGLFLDHRPIRQIIENQAKGKRFLNLFAYTGTASIHAAIGGAATTTTVDLSRTYVEWTAMNFALNGFAENNHSMVKADCLQWLSKERDLYDLIFVDPPTFSNTQKDNRVFDVQRDHTVLLSKAMARLTKEGTLYFSTNFRRFVLDEQLAQRFQIKDISKSTIPFDFSRNEKIHFCWELRHK
ncbi:MAG: bifunctional 23S rRNA (guanine(2069)-N(7))-methyltransferase RlmK/23S rRNA (guanine(2445)-N(2))-methyltransferase RlmL [Desulfotalea sp.]